MDWIRQKRARFDLIILLYTFKLSNILYEQRIKLIIELYVSQHNKTQEEENEILTIRGNLGCNTYN